jgi:competence protein ComEA
LQQESIELEPTFFINTAGVEQFIIFKRIGDTVAANIVEYRKKGFFGKIADIMNVKGIGQKAFEKIRDQIVMK